jgi:GT2 family glycosyltransferase
MTDGDAVPEKQWLRSLVARRGDNVAVVGGPTACASDDLGSRAVSCLPIQGPTRDEVPLGGARRYDRGFETDRFVYASVTRCCLFRKSALEAIGGFDETIGGTEDVDVNARLLRAGYRLAYTPDAVVRHHHRTRLRGFLRQQWIYALWQTVVMRKNPELAERKHALPAFALLLFLGSIVLAALRPGLWFVPSGAALTGLAVAGAYGLRCATAKRVPALAAAVPPFFLLWMLAWAVGYPSGLVLARRVLGARRPPARRP